MDNIPMGLNESDNSSILDSSEESLSTSLLSLPSSQIFTEPFPSLHSIFCLLETIATVPIRRNLTGNVFANRNGTDTEWLREHEWNGYRMGRERILNGNGTGTEWLRITKMEKSVHQNVNYKRTHSSEHMVVSYAIRVLTKDLETM